MNFRENFKKDMKKCDHHIADLRKQLASRYASVEKVRGQGPSWWTAGGFQDRIGTILSSYTGVGGGSPRNPH